MSASLKLAIAGLGLVGQRHAKAIEQLERAKLCAIIDPLLNKEGLQKFGAAHYQTLEQAINAETLDGIILATPTGLHVEQAQLCVDHNIPILIEKPIAVSSKEAAPLIKTAKAKSVPILVGHHRRHNPINQMAHQIIQEGGIGIPRAAHIQCWFYKPSPYFDEAQWRKQKGAGPISVNLVHDVDLIRYFYGEIVSVQAQAAPSKRGDENEDVAVAILNFENGALGTITVSDSIASPWSWELTSGEYPIYPKTSENCYLLGGSEGSLSIPDLRLWHHEKEPDWWSSICTKRTPCENSDPLVNQMRHFCDVIMGEAEPLVSGEEGLKTLAVIEAIQQAANTGNSVNIADIHNPKWVKAQVI